MSVRQQIIDALKTRLQSASALGEVSYWRDCRMEDGVPATTFRDVASTVELVNNMFQHTVRVEIESYCYGEDLGAEMNSRLSALFRVLNKPLPTDPRCIVRITETASSAAGEGRSAAAVAAVLEIAYRTSSYDI